ncbi:MAG: TonB-dependent receptor [Myxococcales bacterium]|nr:TonB-dependent receptor [Myxococcales bacterium]USN50472.1 MAG: TonB-dependent receptor [Myxococcales bacterium]
MSFQKNIGAVFVFASLQVFTAPQQESKAEISHNNNQTIIEEKIEPVDETNFDYFTDSSSYQTPADSSMLLHIPGLTLTQKGGPLGSSDIRYRGLSHSQLKIDLEGLNLNNPVNGFSDANAMFLFAASRMQASAQSLSISLPHFTTPYAKGIFGIGSEYSIKAGASAGMPIDDYSSIFAAMQISSTNGRFSFSSPYLDKNDPKNQFTRENNDQHRMQGLLKYQRKTPTSGGHILFAINTHEGGIAGFASAPSPDLRSNTVFSGLSLGVSKKLDSVEFYTNVANSLFNYQTSDIPLKNEQFLSSTHEITFGVRPIKWFKGMDFDLAQQIVIEKAYELDQSRFGGGFVMKRVNHLSGRMKPTIFAEFSMIGYEKFGLVFKKNLGFSIEPSKQLTLTARYARSQRLPTFLELYANNNFFVGNPDLTKEGVWDIELGAGYKIGSNAHVHVLAFLGHLSDVIIHIPLFASKYYPINTEEAQRYGVELSFDYEPSDWLKFETKNSFLYTKVKETNAPLPQAPPFLGLSKLRIGPQDFINFSILSRYRGPTSANLNGTLKTDAYALVDAIISARVFKKATTSFSVSNIFNVKTARDTYEMPLPGTIFYAQIELESL